MSIAREAKELVMRINKILPLETTIPVWTYWLFFLFFIALVLFVASYNVVSEANGSFSFKDILPVTGVIAVVLFAIREMLELSRREEARQRKLKAIKRLLALECERNYWTIRVTRFVLESFEEFYIDKEDVEIYHRLQRDGSIRVELRRLNGNLICGHSVTPAHSKEQEKLMLEVATLDGELFTALQVAYDSTLALDNLRQNLEDTIDATRRDGIPDIVSFVDYAKSETTSLFAQYDQLYKACTGNKLENWRVR